MAGSAQQQRDAADIFLETNNFNTPHDTDKERNLHEATVVVAQTSALNIANGGHKTENKVLTEKIFSSGTISFDTSGAGSATSSNGPSALKDKKLVATAVVTATVVAAVSSPTSFHTSENDTDNTGSFHNTHNSCFPDSSTVADPNQSAEKTDPLTGTLTSSNNGSDEMMDDRDSLFGEYEGDDDGVYIADREEIGRASFDEGGIFILTPMSMPALVSRSHSAMDDFYEQTVSTMAVYDEAQAREQVQKRTQQQQRETPWFRSDGRVGNQTQQPVPCFRNEEEQPRPLSERHSGFVRTSINLNGIVASTDGGSDCRDAPDTPQAHLAGVGGKSLKNSSENGSLDVGAKLCVNIAGGGQDKTKSRSDNSRDDYGGSGGKAQFFSSTSSRTETSEETARGDAAELTGKANKVSEKINGVVDRGCIIGENVPAVATRVERIPRNEFEQNITDSDNSDNSDYESFSHHLVKATTSAISKARFQERTFIRSITRGSSLGDFLACFGGGSPVSPLEILEEHGLGSADMTGWLWDDRGGRGGITTGGVGSSVGNELIPVPFSACGGTPTISSSVAKINEYNVCLIRAAERGDESMTENTHDQGLRSAELELIPADTE